jgi:hypothetical protein
VTASAKAEGASDFRRRVGDYAESHSGLPPQTVLNAPGEGGGAHSGLPPQTVFGAFAKSIPKSPN